MWTCLGPGLGGKAAACEAAEQPAAARKGKCATPLLSTFVDRVLFPQKMDSGKKEKGLTPHGLLGGSFIGLYYYNL
jgi:hypothetical protein